MTHVPHQKQHLDLFTLGVGGRKKSYILLNVCGTACLLKGLHVYIWGNVIKWTCHRLTGLGKKNNNICIWKELRYESTPVCCLLCYLYDGKEIYMFICVCVRLYIDSMYKYVYIYL